VWLVQAGLWLGGGSALAFGLLLRPAWSAIEPRLTPVFLNLAQAPDAFPDARAFAGYLRPQFLTLGMVALAAAALMALAWRGRLPAWRWGALAFALIAVDLWLPNRAFHAAVQPELLTFRPQAVAWLADQPGHWRITSFAPHDKVFHANVGWHFDLHDVRGYDSIINRQFVAYMQVIEPQNELMFNRIQPVKAWQALNSPLLDLLAVRYILTSETLNLPKLALVWEGEGLRIYENLAVMPRAWWLPQSAATTAAPDLATAAQQWDLRSVVWLAGDVSTRVMEQPQPATARAATLTHAGNIEVRLDVTTTEPAWLVLADSHAPGWRAFVRPQGAPDSAETELPITLANGNFRAVPLDEPGDYTLRFRYSPRSFIGGALASFMGGAIILFAGAVWGWRRFYRPKTSLTNTESIAKNSIVPMALNLFNKGIDFAFAAFYLRLLGPGQAGAYATAITIALWFDIVSNWGLNALLIREVSQDRAQAGRYLFNTSLLRLFTLLLGLIPVALFVGEGVVNGDPMGRDVLLAIGLLMFGMLFSGMGQGVAGLFYAFEKAEYPAALTTVTTILKVAFGVVVLLSGWGFVGLAGVSILVNLITLLLLMGAAFRHFPLHGPWRPDWPLQRRAFLIGWPLMLNHLLATVFFKIDQPLLYRLDGETAVGWYNSAYKWVDAFNVIPSFFTFALFPVLSRQVVNQLDDARRTFRMAVKLMVLVALPLAVVVTFSADIMIGILGGREFLPAGALALRLVIWSIPIGWINSVTNYTIVALGLERRLTLGFVIGVLFNFFGNILLIPHYGFVAAALTTIASELLLLLVFSWYLHQRMPGIGWMALLWRPAAAGGVMLAVTWAAAQWHLAAGLAAGAIAYLAVLWLLGIVGPEERKIIQSLTRRGA
jgi:O-antigen/teichoic acid export membrane protein